MPAHSDNLFVVLRRGVGSICTSLVGESGCCESVIGACTTHCVHDQLSGVGARCAGACAARAATAGDGGRARLPRPGLPARLALPESSAGGCRLRFDETGFSLWGTEYMEYCFFQSDRCEASVARVTTKVLLLAKHGVAERHDSAQQYRMSVSITVRGIVRSSSALFLRGLGRTAPRLPLCPPHRARRPGPGDEQDRGRVRCVVADGARGVPPPPVFVQRFAQPRAHSALPRPPGEALAHDAAPARRRAGTNPKP